MKTSSATPFFLFLFASLVCVAQSDTAKQEYKFGIGVSLNTIERTDPGLDNIALGAHGGFWDDKLHLLYGSPKSKDKSYSIGLVADYFLESNSSVRFKFGITKTDKHIMNLLL